MQFWLNTIYSMEYYYCVHVHISGFSLSHPLSLPHPPLSLPLYPPPLFPPSLFPLSLPLSPPSRLITVQQILYQLH